MLLMSHCCSCISDYVHCTEIFFPFNSRSLNTKQSQHSAQQFISLGWGWFPAGAPSSITCCSGQCPAARELCPGTAGHRQGNPWAPAAAHNSNTPPVCAECVPPQCSFASVMQMGKAKIKNTLPTLWPRCKHFVMQTSV